MLSRFTKRLATREKRKSQNCKVYSMKLDRSHLSNQDKKMLSLFFKEAKWFYNYCLSLPKVNDADCTIKEVAVKVLDQYETRKFTILQTQHRQAMRERIFSSIKTLSSLKKQGYKIGKLKFKSELNSIPLREYERTYDLDFENNRIKIAGLKKRWLKVNGLNQISPDADIANALLLKKGNDYYLNVTTYEDKQELIVPETSIGIDFGCETQLSFSNGIKVKFEVPVNKRIKRLDRKIMRKNRKNSKKKTQDKLKRKKEYEHLANKKKDIRCKIVSAIKTNFKYVCVQDESIKAWQAGNHGKKITNTAIGGIISDLKHKSHTPIVVDKFFPSTQLCPNCGEKNKLELSERVYSCECGYMNDRDIKSAICIEEEAMKNIPMDCRDFKAREISTSVFFDKLATVSGIEVNKLGSMN